MLPAVQRSFDDLGTPLADVTFCVLDLETTGTSAERCGITEIGAVVVRGGEVLATFSTLVNPGVAIPPEITVLTGITEAMVLPAPRIEQVLPSLLELLGGAVIVGHNVRFDMSFLQAAMQRSGRPRLAHLCRPRRHHRPSARPHSVSTPRYPPCGDRQLVWKGT